MTLGEQRSPLWYSTPVARLGAAGRNVFPPGRGDTHPDQWLWAWVIRFLFLFSPKEKQKKKKGGDGSFKNEKEAHEA